MLITFTLILKFTVPISIIIIGREIANTFLDYAQTLFSLACENIQFWQLLFKPAGETRAQKPDALTIYLFSWRKSLVRSFRGM